MDFDGSDFLADWGGGIAEEGELGDPAPDGGGSGAEAYVGRVDGMAVRWRGGVVEFAVLDAEYLVVEYRCHDTSARW